MGSLRGITKREHLGVCFLLGQVKRDVCPEHRAEKQLPLKWPRKVSAEGGGKSYKAGITEG